MAKHSEAWKRERTMVKLLFPLAILSLAATVASFQLDFEKDLLRVSVTLCSMQSRGFPV
jgi:hypothetical protein